MQLKWGIVGTGRICQDFCLALLTCDSEQHRVVAVSSRNKEQSENFVKNFPFESPVKTYGSQEEIFDDDQVDIVYIGTIEQVHLQLCLKAFQHGKNVLCEKPLAMNEDEARKIIEAAKKSNKFFMEAIWSRFFPIYDHLRAAVQQIGTVTFVECTFGVQNLVANGVWSTLMGIGCYPVQAALIAFNHEEPELVRAVGHTRIFQNEKTDTMATITLRYKDNRMAVLNCIGENIAPINSLIIHGTNGVIRLPTHFWCPTKIHLPNGQIIESDLPETIKPTFYQNSAGLRYEAIAAREQILNGKTEHPYMTHENSIQIARIIESARRQVLDSTD